MEYSRFLFTKANVSKTIQLKYFSATYLHHQREDTGNYTKPKVFHLPIWSCLPHGCKR